MFNFSLMEYELQEALERAQRLDTPLEAHLAVLAEERRQNSLRRRIAGVIMRFALKLDPEAMTLAPRRLALEAANVRD